MVLQPDDFVVGPREARARVGWWWCDGGGIDIDYCAFPTCPGNPRGIVSAPALCFCMLLPPLSSPTLSTSHRQLLARAVSPSVCLSRFLFLSPLLSYRFYFILLFFSPPFSPRETETERNRRTRGFSPGNRFGASLSRAWVFGDRTRGISASLASFIPPETSTSKAIADTLSWENILSKFLKIKFHSKSKVGQPNSNDFSLLPSEYFYSRSNSEYDVYSTVYSTVTGTNLL